MIKLTKRLSFGGLTALLAVAFTCNSNAITIKVKKGGTAPYLYAWTGTAPNETRLTGDWPGTQFTDKDDNGYWTMDVNGTNISLIFNMGNSGPQSGNITEVVGNNGVATFNYNGQTGAFATLPTGYIFRTDKVAYFSCPPSWNTTNLKSQIKHNDYYEAHDVTLIGTDGAGHNVYADLGFTNWGDTPQQIHFYDNVSKDTGWQTYNLGGYYNENGLVTTFSTLSSSSGYTDANFRAGIASQLGINDGGAFAPSMITYLDVSNKGISSLAGVNNFINLQTLIASHNNISTQSFASNPNLAVLDVSFNPQLCGLQSSESSAVTNKCLYLVNNPKLEELYIRNCDMFYAGALQYNTNLRVLDMANNTRFDYINKTARTALTKLEYLDMSNNDLTDVMGFSQFTSLKYVDVSNNTAHVKTFIFKSNTHLEKLIARSCNLRDTTFNMTNFKGATNLKYIDLTGTTVPKVLYLNDKTQLDTLILDGCTGLATTTPISSITNCPQLKYLSFGNVDLYFNSLLSNLNNAKSTLEYLGVENALLNKPNELDGFTALKTVKAKGNPNMKRLLFNNCPSLEEIDVTGNTSLGTADLSSSTMSDPYRTVSIKSCGFSDNHHPTITGISGIPNTILNISGNSFTTVPTDSTFTSKFITMRNCGLSGKFTLTSQPGIVEGLNLTSNTGLTEIQINNTNFTALMLGGLTNLTSLDISGNYGLTSTCGNNTDTNLTSGQGRVYLKESTGLQTLNISNCDIRNASTYNNFDVSHCTALKTINASGNAGNGMTYFQASDLPSGVEEIDLSGCPKLVMTTQYTQLTSKVANSLKTLDVSNCDIVNTPASFSGLTALETLRIGTNPKIASLDVSNVNNLETLDITNNTGMTSLTANNCKLSSLSLSGCTSLTHVDVSNNQFSDMSFVSGSNVSWLDISQNNITGIPANNDNNCPLQTLKMNSSGVTSIANASTYPNLQYLYVQNNNFGADYTLNGNSQLAGLAISNAAANTALTSFTATNNTLLEALDLSGNNSLETLNLHGNSALTKTTATVNDIEGGGGLYIKGLANLQTLDISNSSFNLIGQNNSLLGTGIKTLKASHNNFKTFTNSNYDVGGPSGTTNHRAASDVANKPSLEDLTALEYLDLSYNAICDSVHLYHNTLLKHLDVSHNQILGPLPTTQAETNAMIQKKVMCAVKYSAHHMGQDKTRGISQPYSDAMRDHRKTEDIDGTYRYYDFRPCDLRDTIGIFHLDLQFNTSLEYLDFSSTNIHNTAAGRIYMCPGWERTASTGDDPTSNWNDFVTSGTAYTEYGSTKHHFVWFQNCQKLKVIKADNNNMQSLGISYFPDLDSISCAGMYGDCNFMNDGRGPGNGNKGFPNGMYVYDHSETVLEDGVYTETTYYRGVDGTVAKANEIPVSNRYPSKITYANFSNGDFYYINPYYATAIVSLDVSNNPLQGSTSAYTNKPLDISHCSNIENLNARGCTTINQINAYGLNELETIDVTGSTGLKILRAYDCPKLYHQDQAEFITGLNTCPDLEEIWISNDNIKSLNLDNNTKLKTVKVYDNDQLPALDVTMLSDLENLDAARCKLSELDLSLNTKLRTLDVSNTAKPTSLGENGTNKLSDIVISSPDIESINAAYNNLYCISGLANRTALAALDISHNHINGIDLSGCTNLATINDIDNGRKIVAEYNVVSKKVGNTVTNYDVYFFQTDATAAENEGQTYLSDRTSTDVLKGTQRGDLAIDGFDITKVNGWTSGGTTYTGSKGSAGAPRRSNTPFDPSDADDILDPTKVAGTLVLLDADQPTAEYSYNNGLTTSTYYLEWEAPSTPTAVNDITADEFTATGGTGAILVQSPQDVEVIIVDMSGRIIAQNLIEAGSFTFTDIAPGIYIVNGIKVTVK